MRGRKTTLDWHGPLAVFAHGFDDELRRQGFSTHGRTSQLRLASELSRRLEERGLEARHLTPEFGRDYLQERFPRGRLGLSPLLGYLRSLEVVVQPCPPQTPA